MKFSVVVPVYNAEKFLDACIHSVLSQTYQNFELILVNDGSKDNSGAICDVYAQKDERIKVLHKENAGALSARVAGVAQATGEYLIFLDSDDTLVHNALELIVEKICKTKSKCIIYCCNVVQNGKIVSICCDAKQYGRIEDKRQIYKIIFNNNSFNSMCCKTVHKSLITDLDYGKYYNIAYGEDLLQSLDILRKTDSICFLKTPLYNYNMNPYSAIHNRKYENYKVDFTVEESVLNLLKEENCFTVGDYDEYRNYCIENFVKTLLMIARFDTCRKNKIRLYREMKATGYYQDFLSVGLCNTGVSIGRKNKIFFKLFKYGQYRMMLLIVQIFDKVFKKK